MRIEEEIKKGIEFFWDQFEYEKTYDLIIIIPKNYKYIENSDSKGKWFQFNAVAFNQINDLSLRKNDPLRINIPYKATMVIIQEMMFKQCYDEKAVLLSFSKPKDNKLRKKHIAVCEYSEEYNKIIKEQRSMHNSI